MLPRLRGASPGAARPRPQPRAVETSSGSVDSQHHAVVIGAGWAGFGAAMALAKAGASVTLVDAGQAPGGLATELGIKGFWRGVCRRAAAQTATFYCLSRAHTHRDTPSAAPCSMPTLMRW
jgi:cation diffusion facilitator CzcD-associated flavoprotein CzcO